MKLTLQPIRIATGEEGDGVIVFHEGWLVAVLTRLSDVHGKEAGFWYLETGYGALDVPLHPTFTDLAAAEEWMRSHLADFPRSAFGTQLYAGAQRHGRA